MEGQTLVQTKLADRQAVQSVDLTSEVANTLPVANGGTSVATLPSGQVLIGNGTSAVTGVAAGTAGYILGTSDGTTWTSQPLTRINSTASSATPAINTDTTDQFNITALAAAITSMTSGLTGTPRDGQHLMIRIKDSGTSPGVPRLYRLVWQHFSRRQ
jgi:hypothetical protein